MTIRLGLIGLGGMAERAYLPVLAGLESAELVAVLSRRADRVENIRARYRISSGITERREFLRQDLTAAVVLTPAPTHFEIVKWLLESGLDVLVEKPATQSSRETAELGELAERLGRVLMVAFNRRYAPFYVRAKEMFSSRRVSLCLAEKHRERAVNTSLFAHFYEEDIHLIDLLRWYGGEATAVATRHELRGGKLVDAASLIAFEQGGAGVLAASLEAGGWLERVTLHGENLTVQVEAFRELRVLQGDRDLVENREVASRWASSLDVRGFAPMVRHFVECVRTRAKPLTSAGESFKTQVLLEAMVSQEIETERTN
jgi:virulence factor